MTRTQLSSSTVSTANFTKNLAYDSWGELSEEDDLDGSLSRTRRQDYTYDSNGNRTERDEYNSANSFAQGELETYDVGNRLSNVNHYGSGDVFAYGESFTGNFDGNGDQTQPIGGATSASTYSLSFYPDRRLQTVSGPETSSYDGLGRLSARGSSNFGYDGQTDITDRGSGGWTTMEHVQGADGDLRITYNPTTAPTLEYLLYDPLGNIAMVANSSGTVTENDNSDLYGAYPTQNGSSATGEYDWLGGYGYRYRSGPGVYQVGARAYDPRLGRFMQQDPLSFGNEDYIYAVNSPSNAFDPTGMEIELGGLGLACSIIQATAHAAGLRIPHWLNGLMDVAEGISAATTGVAIAAGSAGAEVATDGAATPILPYTINAASLAFATSGVLLAKGLQDIITPEEPEEPSECKNRGIQSIRKPQRKPSPTGGMR